MSRGYETRDVDLRSVLGAALGLCFAIGAFFALMWALYVSLLDREARSSAPAHRLAAEQSRREPPAPRLQSDPLEDLRALRAENQRLLTTYGWVDEAAGVVRIPIDQAMALALRRGFPVRTDGELSGTPDPAFQEYVRERERAEDRLDEEQPANEPERERRRLRKGGAR